MFFQPILIRFFSKTTKLQKFYPVKKEVIRNEIFPKQHPKKIDSLNNEIITLEKPPVFLTEHKTIPFELYESKNTEFESPEHSKALEVALIGAPNAGKSALFNRFVGGNISAVSNKSNTTDEAIEGAYTNIEKRTQVIFYDTPGIVQQFKGSKHYVTKAWEILDSCDKALFVVDSVKRIDNGIKEALRRLKRLNLGEDFRERMRKIKEVEHIDEITPEILENIRKKETEETFGDQTIPIYLILNKIDLCANKRKLKTLINELEEISRFEKVFFTSAETGYGIQDIITTLEEEAFSRPWEFNPKCKSELSEVDELEQLMRSFVYERFFKEVPYKVGIQLKEFRIRSDGACKVEYKLDVPNSSQVPLIVGANGRNIKYLKERIECELVKKYQKQVLVNITVSHNQERIDVMNEKIQPIYAPGYGMRKAQEEIEAIKKGQLSIEDMRHLKR